MRPAVTGEIYQIGELAARSGVTPDTLRYYERVGLLRKPPRTGGGFRMYTADAVERLRFIKQAQSVGLTLHEIRDLLGYQTSGGLTRCRQVRDMLRAKLAELQARLVELQEFQRTLSDYFQDCERTLSRAGARATPAEPDCPVIETLRTTKR
ncbi:MAG: heavy metal-responsive transcriptional regulator [Acidobacteria bacterium]|nr:heavy metal-responsive transcriptional regulator [Acidobacteriota bacterium]